MSVKTLDMYVAIINILTKEYNENFLNVSIATLCTGNIKLLYTV